jgi:hypothetical protein
MRHPKFLALNGNAIGLWHEGKDYCADHNTDGLIPLYALKTFRFAGKKTIALLATSIGLKDDGTRYAPLWETHDVGYKMHDYLDHNDCREAIIARMEKADEHRLLDRRRKAQYRLQQEERRKTDARLSHDLSTGTNAGQDALTSTESPRPTTTTTTTATSTPTSVGVARARTAPLVTPPREHRSIAFETEIGVHVPRFLHDREFRPRLMNADALTESQADTRLMAWYRETELRFAGKRIGDKPPDFWRARFEEWQGRTEMAIAPSRHQPAWLKPKVSA